MADADMLLRILDLYDMSLYVANFLMYLTPAYVLLGMLIAKNQTFTYLIRYKSLINTKLNIDIIF